MTQLHFHVDQHDVGYMPNNGPDFYDSIHGALRGVWDLAEQHIEYYSQVDQDMLVRGQIGSDDNWTYADEIEDVERQMKEFRAKVSEDLEYVAELAANGLLIVLDAGIAVIEMGPCANECNPEDFYD